MTAKRKIEIFSAGCPACEKTISRIRDVACPSCEAFVLDMQESKVAQRAKGLGVRSVPAVAIDGRLADCCSGRGTCVNVGCIPSKTLIRAAEITRTDRGVALVVTRDGQEDRLEADQVLAATGRQPNTEGLGLAEAGIEVLENGGIAIDDRMRTSKDGVYAASDVTGRDQLVYMAAYGAKIAAENALNGDARRYDATAMPAVVFTDPQVASVGLTEAQARKQGLDVRTATLPLEYVHRLGCCSDGYSL